MLRKIVPMALLCCCPLSALATTSSCGLRGKPAFSFDWLPQDRAEPSVGSVRVRHASGKTVQVLGNLENHYGDSASLQTRSDFNNDGCADLALTNSVGGMGTAGLTVFLYDPATGRFKRNRTLSDIGNLSIDPRDKNCVTGSWKTGADHYRGSRHCWTRGKLVLTEEYAVSPRTNEAGELQCYEQVTTTYRRGKKHERRACTKEP